MKRLSDGDIQQELTTLAGWSGDARGLVRPYTWRTFAEAIAFVNEVAAVAEAAQHHPDIDIRYRAVTVRLVTHDAGGVTDRDVALARAIERAADGMQDDGEGRP